MKSGLPGSMMFEILGFAPITHDPGVKDSYEPARFFCPFSVGHFFANIK